MKAPRSNRSINFNAMIRNTGNKEGYVPFERINEEVYAVRWGLQPVVAPEVVKDKTTRRLVSVGEPKETGKYSWMTHYMYGKPTMTQIRGLVLDWYNRQVDNKILDGFEWKGMPVWLSSENQFNYKAAYDLAVQTGGSNLPVTFKFGTTEDPLYHTFDSIEDLSGFYIGAMSYINARLNEGWKAKDAIDWSVYETAL